MEAPALNDISARLKEYRQQLAAHQKQLEDFELRLEGFRQRQRDFQVHEYGRSMVEDAFDSATAIEQHQNNG